MIYSDVCWHGRNVGTHVQSQQAITITEVTHIKCIIFTESKLLFTCQTW